MPGTVIPSVKPLDGVTTVDEKMSFEPERLSYHSALAVAKAVAERSADDVHGKSVVIAGADFLADLSNLKACALVLDDLAHAYAGLATHASKTAGRILEKSVLAAPVAALSLATASPPVAAVTATASLALGLVSLFRQDVTYSGRPTKIDSLAFEIALASEIKGRGAIEVFVPGLLALSSRPASTLIEDRLAKVQDARAEVWRTVGPLVSDLVMLEAQLAEAVSAEDQEKVTELTVALSQRRREMEPLTAPLDLADRRLSELMTQWNSVDATTGMTALGRLLRAEAVSSLGQVYVHAGVVSSGGYYRTNRSLFRTMFSGDGLSFSGGVVVRWAVLAGDGAVQRGGVLTTTTQAHP